MIKLPIYVLMLVTAYTASIDECGKEDGITASGKPARAGITAAADHLSYGTRIRFLDGSERVIEDRFGAGYTDRLDIYVETKDEAWNFGRQWMFVEVIEDVNCGTNAGIGKTFRGKCRCYGYGMAMQGWTHPTSSVWGCYPYGDPDQQHYSPHL